jgi:hypothetical protein
MASPLLRVTGQGEVNLAAKTLDYHIKPRVIGSLLGQGGAVTVRKGLSIPLHISGPWNAPRVRPEVDPSTIIENIEGVVGGGAGGAGGVAGKIQDILGGKRPPDKSQPPSDQQAPQPASPEQQIQKTIEDIFQKF